MSFMFGKFFSSTQHSLFSNILKLNHKSSINPITIKRNATVLVGGSTKNQGGDKKNPKMRGPKVTSNQLVKVNNVLVKQRWWLESERLWHAGFNVHSGKHGMLNSNIEGHVLYYYDTIEKKKYISVVPLNENAKDYMRPFFTPKEIYQKSRQRILRRIKTDVTLNVKKKNKEIEELRDKQWRYLKHIENIPLEFIVEHEKDARFATYNLNALCDAADILSDIQPLFEEEQLEYAKHNGMSFKYMEKKFTKSVKEEK